MNWLARVSRNQIAVMLADALCALAAIYFAYAARYGAWLPPAATFPYVVTLSAPLAVACLYAFGGYRLVIRYMRFTELMPLVQGYALCALMLFAAAYLLQRPDLPRSAPFLFFAVGVCLSGGIRCAAQAWLARQADARDQGERVLIYGVGSEAVQLAGLLSHGNVYTPVGFLSEDPKLAGRSIHGRLVYLASDIEGALAACRAERIVLANSEAPHARRREILEALAAYDVHVSLPTTQTRAGRQSFDGALRDVEFSDLLERVPAEMDIDRVSAALSGSVVLVTGGGGSIGSEVCRQLMRCRVAKLLVLDHSEYSLFRVHRELTTASPGGIPVVPVLGDVGDAVLLRQLIHDHGVHYIYHAAAYKHVGMLQENALTAIANNTLATYHAARVADAAGVRGFLLVSTDKAVRPVSALGVSKRLAELAVRCVAARSASRCRFAIVRFGNVLGSSGSVVPLFAQQIDAGGPIRVTHPDATRYLMTIPEAAQLIIESSLLDEQGQTYVLDMGEPVRIADLARKLLELKGHAVDGDTPIEIDYIGLRDGEKLHEELVDRGELQETDHPHIRKVIEPLPDPHLIERLMDDLEREVARRNQAAVDALTASFVAEQATPSSPAALGS